MGLAFVESELFRDEILVLFRVLAFFDEDHVG